MTWRLLVLLAAVGGIGGCKDATPPPADSDSREADTPGETEDTPDPESDLPPAPAGRVSISPAEPAYTDDLLCTVTGNEVPVASIAWAVDGQPWTGATGTTAFSGDTVDDLNQAGGQTWRCMATLSDGSSVVSEAATIRHPVPMARVPRGTVPFRRNADGSVVTVSISRPYWIAAVELTREAWMEVAGYDAVRPIDIPNIPAGVVGMPATVASPDQAFWFANMLSARDGLPSCYQCTGSGEDVQCSSLSGDADCHGYRLVHHVEWVHAWNEGGRHDAPLPTGHFWIADAWLDENMEQYDAEIVNGTSPRNDTISDQCWLIAWSRDRTRYYMPVGLITPNSLGIYDMCGNIREYFGDSDPFEPDLGLTDPVGVRSPRRTLCSMVDSGTPTSGIDKFGYSRNCTQAGVRLARTIHPPGEVTP